MVVVARPGDLDGDGLRDSVETGTGIYVSAENTGTRPDLRDSDGDSLPDGLELNLGTDPNNPASKVKRPNIIYISADDLGYGDVGCFWQNQRTGNWKFATPGLDAMAAQGAMLTHHYVGAPICAPSRACFLLGQHQGNAQIRDTEFDKPLPDNHNVAGMLQAAGYRTVHVGKAGLAGRNIDPLASSETLPGHPLKRGFDRFFGYLRHADGHEHYPRNGTAPRLAVIHDDYTPVTDAYVDLFTGDAWTAFAKKTIIEETAQHPDRPFFLYLSYDTPHFYGCTSPAATYPPGSGIGGGIRWLGAPAYANTAVGDPNRVNNSANVHPSTSPLWYQQARNHVSMIRRMDESVSDLLQTLRDLGIADNTLVVFTSDNGPADTETPPSAFQSYAGFEGIKFDLWEGGIRVPTIVWWPGTIVGTDQLSDIRKIARPSVNYDWMTTFAELAGIACPAVSDGVSLVPELTGRGQQKEHDFLFFDTRYGLFTPSYPDFPNHGAETRLQMQAIRIGNLIGVRYNIESPSDPFRIYDVTVDAKQAVNLAPSHPQLQARMQELGVGARRKSYGTGRTYDDALIPAVAPETTRSGLAWKAYQGQWPWLPDFRGMAPVAEGHAAQPSADLLPRPTDAGLSMEGYVSVPADGMYTFQLESDDSACLWIHEGLAIENDWSFATARSSVPTNLAAGLHPIRIHYRHRSQAASLVLKYSGPGIALQPVPASALFSRPPQPAAIEPSLDTDGDGQPDADELVAGTDPSDSRSRFVIDTITSDLDSIRLGWRPVAGRTYRVEACDDLSAWFPVPGVAPYVADSTVLSATVEIPKNGVGRRFLRLEVELTP